MSTICGFPATCPHGTRQTGNAAYAKYADGCLTTSTLPRLFWSERDRKGGSLGTAIWPNEYLRDWDEALILNAGDELYDEAARLNRISDGLASVAAGTIEKWPCGCVANTADAHRGACPDYLREVPWTDRVED